MYINSYWTACSPHLQVPPLLIAPPLAPPLPPLLCTEDRTFINTISLLHVHVHCTYLFDCRNPGPLLAFWPAAK